MSSKSNMDRDAVWAAFGVPDAALRRVMGLDLSALSRRESSAAAAKAVQGTPGASRADAVETCADDLQQRCIRCWTWAVSRAVRAFTVTVNCK